MSWKNNKTGEMFPPVCFDDKKCIDGEWIEDDDWDGTYFTNDYQEITADDAENFAEALEKALEYMSGDKPIETGVAEELDQGNCGLLLEKLCKSMENRPRFYHIPEFSRA